MSSVILVSASPPISNNTIVQGDSYQLVFDLGPDYPSDTWAGQLTFSSFGFTPVNFPASPVVGQPTQYQVFIDSEKSLQLPIGTCDLYMVMTQSGSIALVTQFVPTDINTNSDKFMIAGSGLANDDVIYFDPESEASQLPTPLQEDVPYYVVGAGPNSFQVSAASGGAAVDLTDGGAGTIAIWQFTPATPPPIRNSLLFGSVAVASNPLLPYAPATPNQQMLAAVNDTIKVILSQPEQTASFNGQSYTLHNIRDLFNIRNELIPLVSQELRSAGLITHPSYRIIQNRFV